MKVSFPTLGGIVLASFFCLAWDQNSLQDKPQEKPKEAAGSTERKNPIKPTPANLAEAKKYFGYDCAMCHGTNGDGKGDLAGSMSLKMSDWHEPATLAGLSDGEIFDIIVKGKGKMEGEGDRVKDEMVWKLVNYVRSFAKKG